MTTITQGFRSELETALANPAMAKELQRKLGIGEASFTIGTESANAITVNVQCNDFRGDALTARTAVKVFVLADANGDALNATNYTTIAAGTDGVVAETVADKVLECITEADGDLDIVLTLSSGAATSYLGVVCGDGSLSVSGAITHAA